MEERPHRQELFAPVVMLAASTVVIIVLLSLTMSFFLPQQHGVLGGIGILVVTTGLVGAIIISALPSSGRREARAYPAAIRATVQVLPVAGMLGTVIAYSAFLNKGYSAEIAAYSAITFGLLFAFVAWLVATVLYSSSTDAEHANPTNYHLIREQLDRLQNRYNYACCRHSEHASSEGEIEEPAPNEACGQAAIQFAHIEASFKKPGLPWITGVGYVDLWRRIHRAEEALLLVEPGDQVVQEAKRDLSRLVGSNLSNRDSLTESLNSEVIDKLGDHSERAANQTSAARAAARVRYEINSFNDDTWAGIIRARNRLLITSLALGLAAYVLLTLAIVGGASPAEVLWAGIYAVVGASIGLFARSHAEAAADTATDDFGLSTARLIHTPLFSGLGAVLGVVVIVVLDMHFLGINTNTSDVPALKETFSNNPNLLVFAAVFGLAPDLVIQRLTRQADKYKQDLKSTQGNRDQTQ